VIAAWMLYCVGIGLAFVVVGYALERGLLLAGRPTRWAWVVALVGSCLVPAAAWVRPDAFATLAVPLTSSVQPAPSSSTLATSTTPTILDQPPARSFTLADLDLPLRWGWAVASIAILLTLAGAATRLVSLRRRWRQATVDGRSVLLSQNVGPAVVGVWSPSVVLPEWALELPAVDRELMLAHEEQHLRAADPTVIAAGFVLVLLAPWNLALWWQWRRLRLAVEMDCDARVLAEGRSPPAYGELLLHVGRRRATQLVGAAAFGEPASFLETRIRRMLATMPRWRWAGVAAAVVVAGGALVGACETPRPLSPVPEAAEAKGALPIGIPGIVTAVISPTDLDRAPAVLSGATTDFPDLLRLAGIEGRVVLQVRIETDGGVDQGSIAVVQSPHPALAEAAKHAVLRARFRPALAGGHAVDAVVRVAYDFVITSATIQHRARELMDRMAVQWAEGRRPWVKENLERHAPRLLTERSGPPVDVYLIHDSKLRVLQSAVITPGGGSIGIPELRSAFEDYNPGHDAWGVIDPRGLHGLVRDNVRVIYMHHDPQAYESSRQAVEDQGDRVRRLAREYHPEVFRQVGSKVAIALVLDAQNRVLAHAAKTGEARGPDGLYYSGEDCRQVLERLVPQYHNTRWSVSGCADYGHPMDVIVYWGVPLLPLTR
jgi:TonB family protein